MEKYEGKLSEHSKECRIKTIPSFIEIISFQADPSTCIVGPFNEFRIYLDFIERKGRYQDIPISFWKAFMKNIRALSCFIIVAMTGKYGNREYLISPQFGAEPFYWRCTVAALICKNFMYAAYSCWFFSDGGNVASGYAYSGTDDKGSHKFNHLSTNFAEIEFAT